MKKDSDMGKNIIFRRNIYIVFFKTFEFIFKYFILFSYISLWEMQTITVAKTAVKKFINTFNLSFLIYSLNSFYSIILV